MSNTTITEPINADKTVFLKIFAYNNFKYLTPSANNLPINPNKIDADINTNTDLISKLGMAEILCTSCALHRAKE